MKIIPFLFIFLLLCCTKENDNAVYTPFPDSVAYWLYICNFNCSGAGQICWNDYILYKQEGDTILNNKKYHKIYSIWLKDSWPMYGSKDTSLFEINLCGYQDYYNLEGFIRQDIADKKVYYQGLEETSETLLYDFNINEGDTLPYNYIFKTNRITITSIDMMNISGHIHKTYSIDIFTSNPEVYKIIEGIGTNRELFKSCGSMSILLFFKNDKIVYVKPETKIKFLCDK